MSAYAYSRGLVQFQKANQAAAVIVVPMREDGDIDRAQVDAQPLCVICKGIGLTCVEKDLVAVRFDVKTETVFCDQVITDGGIFDQCQDLHKRSSNFLYGLLGRLGDECGEIFAGAAKKGAFVIDLSMG